MEKLKYLSAVIIGLGSVLKILHLPGAGMSLIIGITGISVYCVSKLLKNEYKEYSK